jgi:hypothetical protein
VRCDPKLRSWLAAADTRRTPGVMSRHPVASRSEKPPLSTTAACTVSCAWSCRRVPPGTVATSEESMPVRRDREGHGCNAACGHFLRFCSRYPRLCNRATGLRHVDTHPASGCELRDAHRATPGVASCGQVLRNLPVLALVLVGENQELAHVAGFRRETLLRIRASQHLTPDPPQGASPDVWTSGAQD